MEKEKGFLSLHFICKLQIFWQEYFSSDVNGMSH